MAAELLERPFHFREQVAADAGGDLEAPGGLGGDSLPLHLHVAFLDVGDVPHVRAIGAVHDDPPPARHVADDPVAGGRLAAAGNADHEVALLPDAHADLALVLDAGFGLGGLVPGPR